MTGERRRWNVGVTKIPRADRDVARDILGDTGTNRGFFNILGADTPDDHDTFPLGSDCAYTVDLTDEEAERFRAASNCRYIELDEPTAFPCAAANVPLPTSRAWMRQNTFTGYEGFHGRTVNIGILDCGTTPALRNYMGYTLVARSFVDAADPPPVNTTYGADHVHGSYVASAAIPAGGRLLDYNIANRALEVSPSGIAAGLRWCCDNGARVINCSYGYFGVNTNPIRDALIYMGNFDCVFFASAGNQASSQILSPGSYAFTIPYSHCVMSFEEATGRLAATSSYTTNANAGVAPGHNIIGVGPDAIERAWQGTSAASPFAASNVAMMMTKGTYTAKQCSTALKQNFRNLGLTYQGGGGYDMEAALDDLGAFDLPLAAAGSWMGMW